MGFRLYTKDNREICHALRQPLPRIFWEYFTILNFIATLSNKCGTITTRGAFVSFKLCVYILNKTLLQLNEGDGAFYGPKIDISVSDALSRKFQCGTLQLPDSFKLEFSTEDEAKIERPITIHRSILGSVESMFAILLKHYKGKWPFWLSPRQAILCPVSEKSQAYALQVEEARLAQYNYILVVGEDESNTGQVSVQVRDNEDHSVIMSIENLLKHFRDEGAAFHRLYLFTLLLV
ncbi:threonine--tRNA ligase, mitochondrial 1-like [Cicer arietinum]|uniref:threonine--tRNA ligase, mitochondrial 1-like n=1 Tax=Cicer arietinum TaxID=3827 RepID=UPI003CC61CD3